MNTSCNQGKLKKTINFFEIAKHSVRQMCVNCQWVKDPNLCTNLLHHLTDVRLVFTLIRSYFLQKSNVRCCLKIYCIFMIQNLYISFHHTCISIIWILAAIPHFFIFNSQNLTSLFVYCIIAQLLFIFYVAWLTAECRSYKTSVHLFMHAFLFVHEVNTIVQSCLSNHKIYFPNNVRVLSVLWYGRSTLNTAGWISFLPI
jgi:hypothetical protein